MASPAQASTRSGKTYIGNPVKSAKRFNMLGRAAEIDSSSVLVSDNIEVIALAREEGVTVLQQAASVDTMVAVAESLKQLDRLGRTYLMIDFGTDWIYMMPGPLHGRGARVGAAASKAGAEYLIPDDDADEFMIPAVWDDVPANGLENPTRDAVMGGSARNYVASLYDEEFAHARSWEWLHIVAHSLGGDNKEGNLIAGTFTANTQMIPYETLIKKTVIEGGAAKCNYTFECYPNTYVGMYIQMDITLKPKGGFQENILRLFNCTGDLPFDKFQYKVPRPGQ